MGPFVVQNVTELYGHQMITESLDGLSGWGRWTQLCTIYVSHLAQFNEPYVKSQEIILEATEEAPKPA